ncbi:G-protein alpha subunit-domain-containing protein [Xylaria sp. FL1777]|nr:G-protein alpha subunit-domain-containing protein [Xylaria sp. FL1777]
MDPATIFQIVGTVVSLGDAVIRCITRLSALKAQFHDAPIIVTSMIGQLHMVKIAQDQLSPLNSPNFTNDARYRQLAAQIGNALDSFGPILLALGQQLDRYEGTSAERMTAKSRMGFIHGEREMTNLSILLDRQVNALNLLLQAIQCQTWTQQSEVITQKESQSILRLAQDCSSSLVGLEDVASFISENTAAISTQFEFDDVLRSTLLYQAAERSHLRQAIRAKKTNELDEVSTNSLIQRRAIFGFRQAFRTMKLSAPLAVSDILKAQRGIRVDIRHETIVEPSGDNAVIEGGHPQEESLQSNPEDSDRPGSSTETGRPTQPLLSESDSNSPRQQSGFGNWRKAFQRRTSSEHDIKPHGHHPEGENHQSKMTKVLLLGASGAGKTTLLNALRLFTETEHIEHEESYFRTLVWHSALDSVRAVLRAMGASLDIQDMAIARTLLLDPCFDCDRDPALNPQHAKEIAHAISSLRYNREFQKAVKCRTGYQFHDNSDYYIQNINRLAEQAAHRLAPTDGDLLRTQVTTTGIHQTVLTYRGSQFSVYDCGGERSERKKWIHAFEDVSAVIYPVESTGYGRSMREVEEGDRMLEQFTLVESIANSHWFIKSYFIFVFTKIDLLEEYLRDEGVRDHLRRNGISTAVNEYLGDLEKEFRRRARCTETHERVRFVRANLVDVDQHNIAIEILDMLESLDPPDKPLTSEKGPLTLERRNEKGLKKSPISRDGDDISSDENWSVYMGQLQSGVRVAGDYRWL